MKYDFVEIEKKWIARWESEKTYKVTEDSIEKPVDLTDDMTEEEMKKYFNREWNK